MSLHTSEIYGGPEADTLFFYKLCIAIAHIQKELFRKHPLSSEESVTIVFQVDGSIVPLKSFAIRRKTSRVKKKQITFSEPVLLGLCESEYCLLYAEVIFKCILEAEAFFRKNEIPFNVNDYLVILEKTLLALLESELYSCFRIDANIHDKMISKIHEYRMQMSSH